MSSKNKETAWKRVMHGIMLGCRTRGRPRMTWMRNIKAWTGTCLSVRELARKVEERPEERLAVKSRTTTTSLPKVIWEEGRVAALSHTYAVKSPLVTMACPKFAPKSTPSRGPILKPHYLPHPWARPTYDAKRHPDPIRRFSTMHNAPFFRCTYTYARTYVRMDRQTDRSSTGKFDD